MKVSTHKPGTNQLWVRSRWLTLPQEHCAGAEKPSREGPFRLSLCSTSAVRHGSLLELVQRGGTRSCPRGHVLGVGHRLVTLRCRNHKPWKVWSPVSYSFVCKGWIAGARELGGDFVVRTTILFLSISINFKELMLLPLHDRSTNLNLFLLLCCSPHTPDLWEIYYLQDF